MIIYIDADSCPKAVKELLYKAAHQRKVTCIFVANQPLTHPLSPFVKMCCVDKGFDVADTYIANKIQIHDLVITSDIPFAKAIVDHGALVITPHGKQYSKQNIAQAYAMRNFFTELRNTGLLETKTKAFSHTNINTFANALDQLLTKRGFIKQ